MLNPKTKQRELAYTVKIDDILPIEGSDNCECAVVGGWHVMTRKGTFKPGDIAVYFEIDSKLPKRQWSEFLASKHYKIKTQKYTFGGKGNFVSQGLLMALGDFDESAGMPACIAAIQIGWNVAKIHELSGDEYINVPLTKELNVTYSVEEDNKRKSNITKYDKMYQRHLSLFKKYKILRKMFKFDLGKKILFIFLGKKKDTRNWPSWVVKTDEERVQNLPFLFPGDPDEKWIVTEKIDGTSTTFTMKGRKKKEEFYICSRNVNFDKPEKAENCFYETNVYIEMAEKYNIENVLRDILEKHSELEFVTIQGETYGANIQKRDYGLNTHEFMAFNLIFGYKDGQVKRFNTINMKEILADEYNIPCVPILDIITLPETIDEMIEYANGNSVIDGEMREGVVLRTLDGVKSFKSVSNDFLIKYHQ